MKQQTQYTTVERIFAKFSRDLRNTEVHESDIIEWTAEALEFMKIAELQEEAVSFIEVKNHKADLPLGFQSVIQIAKYNNWKGSQDDSLSPCNIVNNIISEDSLNDCGHIILGNFTDNNLVVTDCNGQIIDGEENVVYYRPYFDLKWEYQGWYNSNYYRQNFSVVRLANHSFFNSLVCSETNPEIKEMYNSSVFEYTLAGGFPNMELRFSFQEGYIALAYLKSIIDPQTGYPAIPDDISAITAITYYIKWKMAERFSWEGREGFALEAKNAEERWLKYIRQYLNKTKMPKGVDQYQNLMEQTHYLIPRQRRFAGYFGNLGREEYRRFNNPDYRRKLTYGRY